jgi:hypothetical protein
MGKLTDNRIRLAIQPVEQLLVSTATVAGVPLDPATGSTSPDSVMPLPEQIARVFDLLIALSGVPDYAQVFAQRTGMRSDAMFRRLNIVEPRLAVVEQLLASQQLVSDAQQALLQELLLTQGTQSARLDELTARLELVQAVARNLATDLAANQAHDVLQDAELALIQSRLTADDLALSELRAQNQHEEAAIAVLQATDQVTATQVALTLAKAEAALALGQQEHLANVAQQSQLDNMAAQQQLLKAQQSADEQAIAQAQATANQTLQKLLDDEQAIAKAQATASSATQAAAAAQARADAAQASATAAQARAEQAEADAQLAKTAASTAQAKANDAASAAAAAQTTATAAQQAAATNATALVAVQTAIAGKLDSALVRRGNVGTPGVTIQVLTPTTVQVTFATPFADANYEVFLSKPSSGLLGVELGWLNKTASGFTLTLRNTGAASLAVLASSVDYYAIHN